MYMHVALTSFSIVLCLEQRGGGIHVHACGVNLVFNCHVSGTAGRRYPCTCMWREAFSIVLCLEQQRGGMHVHACGVRCFQLSCV